MPSTYQRGTSGAFGAVTSTLTSPRKHFTRQVELLSGPRINRRLREWLSQLYSEVQSIHLVHLVRVLQPSRALASISLDRWSRLAGPESSEGVVEHYRGSIREGQPQRMPAAEGSHGGRPLSSKPQRCQFLIHARESSLLGTGSGICACGQTPGSPPNA